MYCRNCGTENPNDAIFCKNCGTKLAVNTSVNNLSNHEKPNHSTSYGNELKILKEKIMNATTNDELDHLRRSNEKKYWWSSIIVCGLFYGLNEKVDKLIISLLIMFFTFIIFPSNFGSSLVIAIYYFYLIYYFYMIYTSYRDQKFFNNEMEVYISKRKRELNCQYG